LLFIKTISTTALKYIRYYLFKFLYITINFSSCQADISRSANRVSHRLSHSAKRLSQSANRLSQIAYCIAQIAYS